MLYETCAFDKILKKCFKIHLNYSGCTAGIPVGTPVTTVPSMVVEQVHLVP